ncbi:hypothetical protein [Actinophytocola sp.]|uniref:hypothetical protein n=1 Tax=Actinophytocola sp. TaxID=1872138 RepID=UPI002D7E76C8|nr:hypothetical protein [Actinophytocola sp.]HET9144136.1 hypothetical protein [Actinophytocola sp.]
MSDSRADANLAKPQAFETKQLPGTYSPAPTPEFHQQTIDPGYSNSPGPEGDDGGSEWPTSDAAAGKFTADQPESASGADSSGSDSSSTKTGTASRKTSSSK